MSSDVRYGGFVVQGKCRICGYEGKTQVHHIISQAKTNALKTGDHNFDNNLKTNLGNMVELCVPCHDQTSHSFYRKFMMDLERGLEKTSSAHRNNWKAKANQGRKRKRRSRNHCVFVKPDGTRCGQKQMTIPKGGYCHWHIGEAPEGHPQYSLPDYKSSPPPGLRDEDDWEGDRFLDAEHIAAIQDIHIFGVEPVEYELELFADWSEAWRRRWLYGEKW